VSSLNTPKVVGGTDVTPGELPWQVPQPFCFFFFVRYPFFHDYFFKPVLRVRLSTGWNDTRIKKLTLNTQPSRTIYVEKIF
jgi:hypothetical protein